MDNRERYIVLSKCLTLLQGHMRIMSESETMLIPRPGYESAWAETEKDCETIRAMMREARYGEK